jgi:hypothetical protein
MDVEAKRTFKYGFVLRETDLRRLIDTAAQQLAKVADVHIGEPSFRMKFRNGVFANASGLDEVFEQENTGSKQIIRLRYEQSATKPSSTSEPSRILLEFVNADADEEPGYVSLRYQVFGHDRDWVFVTSSVLEERFEKMKRFALNQVGTRGWGRLVFLFIFSLFPLGIYFSQFAFDSARKQPTPSQKLQAAASSGQIKDALGALIFLEQQREAKEHTAEISVVKPFGYLFAGGAVLILVWAFFYKYYPVYNFCWGEYIEEFRKKEAARRFWLVVVLIGLVLSFIGSMLANKLHW